jgi:hypothetical protein
MYTIDTTASQAVEYLIETEDCDEREEEYAQEDDLLDENEIDGSEQIDSESTLCYEEVDSLRQDLEEDDHHIKFQRAKTKEDDELEAWLSSVRESMNKLTNLNRARAKRDINTILSKYEIEQYEAEN